MTIFSVTRRLLLVGVAGLIAATPIQASEMIGRASSSATTQHKALPAQTSPRAQESPLGTASVLPNGSSCPALAGPLQASLGKGGDGSSIAGHAGAIGAERGCRPLPIHVNRPFVLTAAKQDVALGRHHAAFTAHLQRMKNVIGP